MFVSPQESQLHEDGASMYASSLDLGQFSRVQHFSEWPVLQIIN